MGAKCQVRSIVMRESLERVGREQFYFEANLGLRDERRLSKYRGETFKAGEQQAEPTPVWGQTE